MFQGKKFVLFGIVLMSLLLGGVAEAYILPAKFYLKKVASQRIPFTRLQVWQTTTDKQTGKRYQERLYIRIPGKIRLERRRGGKLIQVDVWKDQVWLQWKKGQKTIRKRRRPQVRFDVFGVEPAGYGYGNLSSLLDKLQVNYLGVIKYDRDSDYLEQLRISLAWFRGAPAVVIGASNRDRRSNQLWIHKKNYVPLRYIGKTRQKKGGLIDVRFLDYFKKRGRSVFPSRVEVYRNGKLVLQSLVHRIKTGKRIPSSLFNRLP